MSKIDMPEVSDQAEKEWCFVWPSAADVADMVDALRERVALIEAGWTLQERAALDRMEDGDGDEEKAET